MKIETLDVQGLYHAIAGMRNPMKSYDKRDSYQYPWFTLGENDYKLAKSLWQAGTEHRKYLRMIQVWANIWAPRYFWVEWDTYKIATVSNSESTMHKLLQEEFDYQDFEYPKFANADWDIEAAFRDYIDLLRTTADRAKLESSDKQYYLRILKAMLPESFIQKRTVCLNYETLATMYRQRKNHKLSEWSIDFVNWVNTLPHNEFITGEFDLT